jgi:hypothetical protein
MDHSDIRQWISLCEAKALDQRPVAALIRGVLSGKLLVHVRAKDGTDFKFGIDPSAGEFLRSTESWQTAEEAHGHGAELTFFADDFAWATSSNFSKLKNATHMQAIFVRKNPGIVQDVGNGKVRTNTGAIIPYDRSMIADHEDPVYRDLPGGVEPNDWFTREPQDVLAVVDITDLVTVLNLMRRENQ